MNDIVRTGAWSPGGGRWVEVVPVAQVASLSGTTVTLRAGCRWCRIYTTPDNLELTVTETETDDGIVYQTVIDGFSPDDTPTKAGILAELARWGAVLARFCDNAGRTKLLGSLTEYLTIDYRFGTDRAVPGSRGYNIKIAGSQTLYPQYL